MKWRHRRSRIKHAPDDIIRIAIAGNPNAGKTSIFNALTGQSQHVGNYPGVTVEQKIGRIDYDGYTLEFVDLPGTYSLSAFSIEEMVARDFVLREKPDVIIDVLDSTNLERNLYLCLQFQELGMPIVGVLNMSDEARRNGISIDEKQLGIILGIPFVKTIGSRGIGMQELLGKTLAVAQGRIPSNVRHLNYGVELETQHNRIIQSLQSDPTFVDNFPPHWIAIKLLENDSDAVTKIQKQHVSSESVLATAHDSREWIRKHFGEDSEIVVGEQRYAYIHGACREVVQTEESPNRSDYTEMIDRIVLNKYCGLGIFVGIMFMIYQLTFKLGRPLSDYIDHLFGWIQTVVQSILPNGIIKDLIVEGIIGGVGGVLVFFPIVVLLFLGLSFLEDTGYLARAAFVMDKFMHLFGLHGRSFIPMMVSTGCAVPGVMSARTLVNPKDRVLTIMIAPLMMCSAKTPVIAMLTAAFFPKYAGTVFWSIWIIGWLVSLLIAKLFRNTIYKGEASPFVMELPPYRMPTLRGIFTHMWEKSWSYVKKAGTFILAASIIIWFILYFPRSQETVQSYQNKMGVLTTAYTEHLATLTSENERQLVTEQYLQQVSIIQNQLARDELEHSVGGRLGRFIEPMFKPCGFDWRLDIALMAGFAAKEVIISTMGIVYGIGESDLEADIAGEHIASPLKQKLSNDPHYHPGNMLALMIFVLIYVPCLATLAVVKKELGKWRYPLFLAGYTLFFAWLLAVIVFQGTRLLGIGG
ncbi:ferrous iron transport protein B [candidate division KSB1 bacterium]|nr:ferrous iron transport protein B [candidate division KSB1 bacterium]